MCLICNLVEVITDLMIYHTNLSYNQFTNLLHVSVEMTDRCKQL